VNSHIVTYYIRGSEYINIVAVQEAEDWKLESWSEEGSVSDMQDIFTGYVPQISEFLARADKVFKWAIYHRPPLPTWSSDKIVLLGDAAHPMVPFLAQGAAMAIEDAYVLAELLSQPIALSQALKCYESSRMGRTRKVQRTAQMNQHIFHAQNNITQMLKSKPLQMIDRLAPYIIRQKMDWLYRYDAENSF
jgi:salicylate hydroxylase